jgi:hypothetical protein
MTGMVTVAEKNAQNIREELRTDLKAAQRGPEVAHGRAKGEREDALARRPARSDGHMTAEIPTFKCATCVNE